MCRNDDAVCFLLQNSRCRVFSRFQNRCFFLTFPLLGKSYFFACAAMPRNRAKRDAKNSRSAERGCSSVLPPPNRRRTVGASNPALSLAGYAAQSRSDAQTALLPKTQPAAPYAAETSRYVPPLYTYPTKFMHNLCHIVM